MLLIIIINMTNITNTNLNLLKALDTLLTEQNVSKAGERIGITQSGMSITLGQLRKLYNDDLLVRSSHGHMQLTAFAKKLIQPVKEAMFHAEAVFVASAPFDPVTSVRTYHIGMSDYIAFVLLPILMQKVIKLAPHVKIVQHAVNHMDNLELFEKYNLDVVIGDFQTVPGSLKTTQLFTDQGVIVADKHHPAFRDKVLTVKKLLEYPQVFVTLESQPEENFIVEMLKKMGHKVTISLMTPHTLIALQTLPGTQLMTNTVIRLAEPFLQSLGLMMRETPYKLRQYRAKLYWHARDHNDKGHIWLRELIKDISNTIS
jgi:DNA-binding transcriptional LysR family regulator